MTKPTIREHNVETNEVLNREMTDAEFADYQAMIETQKTNAKITSNSGKLEQFLLQ